LKKVKHAKISAKKKEREKAKAQEKRAQKECKKAKAQRKRAQKSDSLRKM
jgi:hypothetical protein